MKFEDIFKEPGLYKSDTFAKGFAFKIDKNLTLTTVQYSSVDDLLPNESNILCIYAGLFNKKYEKVFIIKQLF